MDRTVTEGSNLAQGSWEEAEAMVGRTLLKVEGADPVSKADIRRKLAAAFADSGAMSPQEMHAL
jgi:hypothetical protein